MARRPMTADLDRRQLITGLCAVGSMACFGCSRFAHASEEHHEPVHKFEAMSEMSFEAVFKLAYANSFIPTMTLLADRIGMEKIQSAACDSAASEVRRMAEALPSRSLADWTESLKHPNHLWKHVLTVDIVEDTESAFEVRVTECLWATTFREAGAADLGYSWVCHPDFAMASAFNPKMRLTRDSTLMQGRSHCNHRWEMEA